MIAFHGDPKIKQKYIDRVKAHQEADEIVKGIYWENGKGCAVGCTIHGSSHADYEIELGISRILARLEDSIFEKLPLAKAKEWPLKFLETIKIGADLSAVWPKFAIYLLMDPSQCASRHAQCKIVAEAYEKMLAGEKIDWFLIKKAAAAYAAADAAAYAAYAAAYAAYAAAYAAYAAYAAAYAAYAAYAAADADAAAAYAAYKSKRRETIILQSEKLLALLKDAT